MTDPKAAREALGVRLRDMRLDAGLNGRQLAAVTGFSPQKVSRIENGVQNIKEADIRAWAAACSASWQVPELIAVRREVARLWREHRRELRAGLVHIQSQNTDVYAATSLLRVYESTAIPGLLYTEDVAAAAIETVARLYGRPVEEARPAARAKLARQALLLRPTGRNAYHFVIEAGVLDIGHGGAEAMDAQLDFLVQVTRMPHVAFGIIPPLADRRIVSKEGFYIFDERLVRADVWTVAIETRRREQIDFYLRVFDDLRRMAVYGDPARELIEAARQRLR
ncbi:Scr1 family TA system antitoxin-like transcriptional regulator [Actinomadura gamaensis]|uniref:Scr1 family TA system antitoxin-like transcriptional regulator n=1 Tax=Actinomadura gamaensis TaxID=1763541 RepID=A0ABV9U8U5_9ACTN